jgi:hypothetical protein
MKGYLVKSAEQIPEAGGQAMGEKPPAMQDFEKTTGKAALVKALNDSFTYCDAAYRMADTRAAEPAEVEGTEGTRMVPPSSQPAGM